MGDAEEGMEGGGELELTQVIPGKTQELELAEQGAFRKMESPGGSEIVVAELEAAQARKGLAFLEVDYGVAGQAIVA